MNHLLAAVIALGLVAVSCGGTDNTLPVVSNGDLAGSSCLVGDPNCADGADGGAAAGLPDVVTLADPSDPDAPLAISFGGFFFSDGNVSQLCAALAESFPPQCAATVIELDAPLDTVLEHVAESWGNPADAKINIDQGIYWTDQWINLSGTLELGKLALD